jgi:phytoene synthase
MNTVALYDSVCNDLSGHVVSRYSTSFSIGIRALHPRFRGPIKAIYAYVRFADEIVDTFHAHDKRDLLERFRAETSRAMDEGISLNPVLHSFQQTARGYGIGQELIDPFLDSMAMDLEQETHDSASFNNYIFGSAEVVGLMCLRVFCEGDDARYNVLKPAAQRLGAAFQKVNFLRDVQDDHAALGRTYFPDIDVQHLDEKAKCKAEASIIADFQAALAGIKNLPKGSRFGVYVAYAYYLALFRKIQGLSAGRIMQERIRIGKRAKMRLLTTSFLRHSFNNL